MNITVKFSEIAQTAGIDSTLVEKLSNELFDNHSASMQTDELAEKPKMWRESFARGEWGDDPDLACQVQCDAVEKIVALATEKGITMITD